MKCTNKLKKIVSMLCILTFLGVLLSGCSAKAPATSYAAIYENTVLNQDLYRGELFAHDLCVSAQDVDIEQYTEKNETYATGLFDLNQQKVLYADRIHETLFPASTTKVLTAYIALKYGNMDDIVTVGESLNTLDPESSVCGLQVGDQVTLFDLVCGLTLASGNDAAVAIAEHISGSVEAFAAKMNEEALALGATNSHFVNPHGLQDDNHYTTAYDLYLFFNAAIQDQRYIDILSMKSYDGTVTRADGTTETLQWNATNFYSAGEVDVPEGIKVLGGKTGTTDQAGSCVILYNEDLSGNPYISIIMGAPNKLVLYDSMSRLLSVGITQ